MKYIIYKLVTPSFLKEIEQDGYDRKIINRNVLQKLDVPHVEDEHPTMEAAVAEITAKKDLLKHLELTIVPVIRIAWDGEIRE